MKTRKMLFFVSFPVLASLAITTAVAQDASTSRPPARLHAYTTVKKAPPGARAQMPGSPTLPEWTFSVQCTRDHTDYTVVMVGGNPFGNESNKVADVPTEIVPVVITTNLVGPSVDS